MLLLVGSPIGLGMDPELGEDGLFLDEETGEASDTGLDFGDLLGYGLLLSHCGNCFDKLICCCFLRTKIMRYFGNSK